MTANELLAFVVPGDRVDRLEKSHKRERAGERGGVGGVKGHMSRWPELYTFTCEDIRSGRFNQECWEVTRRNCPRSEMVVMDFSPGFYRDMLT